MSKLTPLFIHSCYTYWEHECSWTCPTWCGTRWNSACSTWRASSMTAATSSSEIHLQAGFTCTSCDPVTGGGAWLHYLIMDLRFSHDFMFMPTGLRGWQGHPTCYSGRRVRQRPLRHRFGAKIRLILTTSGLGPRGGVCCDRWLMCGGNRSDDLWLASGLRVADGELPHLAQPNKFA